MKEKTFVFLVFLSLNNIWGQAPEHEYSDCMNCALMQGDRYSRRLLRIDTLFSFNDGIRKYSLLREYRFRNDTIMRIYEYDVPYRADTSFKDYFKQEFSIFEMPLVPEYVDTTWNEDDPSIIDLIDTLYDVKLEYAQFFKANKVSFYKTIIDFEERAVSQGFSVVEILFLNFKTNHHPLVYFRNFDEFKETYFEESDFIGIKFILQKFDQRIYYPIVFQLEDG